MVLVGGDGTLHAAANAPLARLPELALVPAGRANNIARALGIPTTAPAALAVAAGRRRGRSTRCAWPRPDRFVYALEAVSAGFQAEARAGYQGENSADLRQGLRALVARARALPALPGPRARVDGDADRLADAGRAALPLEPALLRLRLRGRPGRRSRGWPLRGDPARGARPRPAAAAARRRPPRPPSRAARRAARGPSARTADRAAPAGGRRRCRSAPPTATVSVEPARLRVRRRVWGRRHDRPPPLASAAAACWSRSRWPRSAPARAARSPPPTCRCCSSGSRTRRP